jgi:hypothetical protein
MLLPWEMLDRGEMHLMSALDHHDRKSGQIEEEVIGVGTSLSKAVNKPKASSPNLPKPVKQSFPLGEYEEL